jgi:hypothetical protein
MIAQATRAILLASATATSLPGLRRSSARSQSVMCRLPGFKAALMIEVAPDTRRLRNRSWPARLIPPFAVCLPSSSLVFTGTKCMPGRPAASQIASASLRSFLPRLTNQEVAVMRRHVA